MKDYRQVTDDTGVHVSDDDKTPLTVVRSGRVIYTEVPGDAGSDDNGRSGSRSDE